VAFVETMVIALVARSLVVSPVASSLQVTVWVTNSEIIFVLAMEDFHPINGPTGASS